MEFVDLSRYRELDAARIPTFSVLRHMNPVWMTYDLEPVPDEDNLAYIDKLAEKSIAIVPIKRKPPVEKYLNRNDFPRRVLFEMTSRCNFLCRMCPQQNLRRPKIDMPGDQCRRIIDEIDNHGIESLSLFQFGEPILHREFRQNLEHIKTKKNLGVIWFSTNGALFKEEYIQCVLNSNITYINFSANAVTRETYYAVIGQDVFKKVQANLNTLYRIKKREKKPTQPFIRVQMIEQDTTKHEIDAFLAKHYQHADIVSINMLEHLEIQSNRFGLEQRIRKPLTSCVRIDRNDCFIWSNGWVGLCDAAYNGEICLGDVSKDSLYNIWNGKERKRLLALNRAGRMSEIPFCNTCKDYDI